MTKEEIVSAIKDLTEKLGHVPSHAELSKHSPITRRQLRKEFGSYARALVACKLQRAGCGKKIETESLFLDWAEIVRILKKTPTQIEYEQYSKYSINPLRTRFGGWGHAPRELKRFAQEHGLADEWTDVLNIIAAEGHDDEAGRSRPEGASTGQKWLIDGPVYGPPLRRDALAFGPTNEAGVLFLFGAMAEFLGFIVTRIQTEFPDCEAMRVMDDGRCQRLHAELEYESRNFLRHLHDAKNCDLIVCWIHNWPECPLPVLELSKEFKRWQASLSQERAKCPHCQK